VLIGAPGDDIAGNQDVGSVTIFERRNGSWIEVVALARPNAQAFDRFGSAVALNATDALVGAPGADIGAVNNRGAVQRFRLELGSWVALTELRGGSSEAGFGSALASFEDRLLVGAPFDQVSGIGVAGRAYLFRFDGLDWRLEVALQALPVSPQGGFGSQVAIARNLLVVGAPDTNSQSGAVTVFERALGLWRIGRNYTRAGAGQLGSAVAINQGEVIMGVPNAERMGVAGAGTIMRRVMGSTDQIHLSSFERAE
jgi:FG-GAP repeat